MPATLSDGEILLDRHTERDLDAHLIELQIEPDNKASLRAALAAGFVQNGVIRERQPIREPRDMVLLVLGATRQ